MTVANFFWQGLSLSLYEKACMTSFLRHGFGGRKASITSFSNIYRYRLLARGGGWWFDADVFCLADVEAFRKLQDSSPGLTAAFESESHLNVAILYVADPSLAGELLALAEAKGRVVECGEIGPWLLTEYFRIRPERIAALSKEIFYPIHFSEVARLPDPEARKACREAAANSLCVHLWNNILVRQEIPKDLWPCEGSYLDELFSSTLTKEAATGVMPAALPGILQERHRLRLENERLRRKLAAMYSSRTWRLGSFIRKLAKPFRKR